MKNLEEYVRNINDFPKKGIIYRDVTTVLSDVSSYSASISFFISMTAILKSVPGTRVLPVYVVSKEVPFERYESSVPAEAATAGFA